MCIRGELIEREGSDFSLLFVFAGLFSQVRTRIDPSEKCVPCAGIYHFLNLLFMIADTKVFRYSSLLCAIRSYKPVVIYQRSLRWRNGGI